MRPLQRLALPLAPFAIALAVGLALPATARAQAGAPAAPGASAVKDLPLTAEERRRFVGDYVVTIVGADRPPLPFRIYEEQGALHGRPEGDEPKRLLYQGDNVFFPEGEPGWSVTFTLEDGQAKRFRVTAPDGSMEGVRVVKQGP